MLHRWGKRKNAFTPRGASCQVLVMHRGVHRGADGAYNNLPITGNLIRFLRCLIRVTICNAMVDNLLG